MGQTLSKRTPQTPPQQRSGADGGLEQLELNIASSSTVSDHIAAVYRALGKAVEKFGGITELAVAMNKSKGEVSLRVRRAEDTKGDVQRAFVDYIGFIASNWEARATFLAELAREWGYKRPEPMYQPTELEQLLALKAELRASGDIGDDVLKRAAARGGFDVTAFRR